MTPISIVAIGASWGGLAALTKLFSAMPERFDVPILVVQHRSRNADNLLAALLQDVTRLRVIDIEDKEPLEANTIYVAPANYHVLVEDGHLALTTDPLVRFSRPSIDVTFASAADAYRSGALGVVLTGANDDGARGLRHIVDLGGRGIVQDPETAESRAMPSAAVKLVPEAEVLPLIRITDRLVELTTNRTKHPNRKAG
jgi:two-component system chemotaxis response regulator CheB